MHRATYHICVYIYLVWMIAPNIMSWSNNRIFPSQMISDSNITFVYITFIDVASDGQEKKRVRCQWLITIHCGPSGTISKHFNIINMWCHIYHKRTTFITQPIFSHTELLAFFAGPIRKQFLWPAIMKSPANQVPGGDFSHKIRSQTSWSKDTTMRPEKNGRHFADDIFK